MKVLFRYRKFPDQVKFGSLNESEIEAATQVLHPGHLQSIGEFWQALGGKPKATLNYTITVALDVEDAEEVTQDTFIKMHKGLGRFQFKSALKTWIYRITVNSAINALNRTKKAKQNTCSYDEKIDLEHATYTDISRNSFFIFSLF